MFIPADIKDISSKLLDKNLFICHSPKQSKTSDILFWESIFPKRENVSYQYIGMEDNFGKEYSYFKTIDGYKKSVEAINLLLDLLFEIEKRKRLLSQFGFRDIYVYNSSPLTYKNPKILDSIYTIIDIEVLKWINDFRLTQTSGINIFQLLLDILKGGKSCGIYFIIKTTHQKLQEDYILDYERNTDIDIIEFLNYENISLFKKNSHMLGLDSIVISDLDGIRDFPKFGFADKDTFENILFSY